VFSVISVVRSGRQMMKRAIVCFALFVTSSIPAQAQRLPGGVIPDHYDLTIATNLASASFTGDETIRVRVAKPTADVVLNAAEITFEKVTISAGGRDRTAAVRLNPRDEQATLHVESPISGDAAIHITYKGVLNDQLRGLYLSKANNRRYAVSQLEATDARRMFPSFDEPAMKATFSLTAIIDRGDHAISNGAVISDTPGPGTVSHTIKFDTTPKMSTYLVALAVGDFICREGSADDVTIRVCATPDKKELTGFALHAAEENLKFYDRYYGIKYPFKKLDIVGVPDFSAGAMENTAAIFYRETFLLADPQSSTEQTRKFIAEVLAHEMAHQWFGDLVTMQWWDDIWLNEGFANWMETKPLKAWNPAWHSELDEVSANQEALRLDALSSTRAIRTKANTPAEINELFDAIAYNKGAAVLRMIEAFVGEDAFRAGVNAYVDRFKYSNARAEDFWTVMTQATGKPVDKVMSTFVDQPGAPLVSLETRCAAAQSAGSQPVEALQQQRFRIATAAAAQKAAAETWNVPVCVRLPDGTSKCDMLMKSAGTMPLPSCPAWVVGNAGGLGYYRVGYTADAVSKIAANAMHLAPGERVSLLSDEWALVRAGRQDVTTYLDLVGAFSGERNHVVFATLAAALDSIGEDLTTASSRAKYREWVRHLLAPALTEVGWTPSASEPDDRKELRAALVTALGETARDPDVIAKSRQLVERLLTGDASIDPALRGPVVAVAALGGDAALYDKYLARARAVSEPDEHYRYLYALARFSDPALVRRTMDLILSSEVRNQDASLFVGALLRNPDARDLAWTLLRQRWDESQKKIGQYLGVSAVGALGTFCSSERAAEIRQFFTAHPVPEAQRTLQQTIEQVESCAARVRAEAPRLAAWLERRN
jgi:puromycin-sensitive aminopeptidase